MAITTLDGIIAGMQSPVEFMKVGAGTQVVGRLYSAAYAAGSPGAMAAPAGGIQGLGLTTKSGMLDFTNPGSGNSYLARFAGECNVAGTLLLCDRLWENSGNSSTSTAAQTHTVAISANTLANPTVVTTAAHGQAAGTFIVHITGSNSTPVIDGTWTATYISGTTFSIPVNVTNAGTAGTCYIAVPPRGRSGGGTGSSGNPVPYGDDIKIAYEVSSLMGAGAPTLTATYVNSDGTAGRTTPSITLTAAMIAGAFIPLPLQAGDTGVRAIATHTKNATQTSGTYHIVMYRVLARVPIIAAGIGGAVDAVTSGFPRMYDNTVPFLVFNPATTTAPSLIGGQLIVTQG
jgi:hypothetical protein